jgi:hypothetical protein
MNTAYPVPVFRHLTTFGVIPAFLLTVSKTDAVH